MVRVEGGTFMMGATKEQGKDAEDREKPAHQVTLSDYYIGKYEVTQVEWELVTGWNPSFFVWDYRPVECVSWEDCQAFIQILNSLTGLQFSLPTEAQWEYAARGGKKSLGYKYSGSKKLRNVAWYDGGTVTNYVGRKQANELGLYDMSGNVWEWCNDWYDSYSSKNQTNPTGAASGKYRVIRGGSCCNFASHCRVSYRNHYTPDDNDYNIGLRLVVNVK